MILAIVGPTCTGKSSLAIKAAKFYNAEIVNFDPYQCYKELTIGVAKPSSSELNEVKHHLISCVSIKDEMSICRFQTMFRDTVNKLISENKNIVLVGGSGLYLRSAIMDYEFSENPAEHEYFNNLSDDEVRNKLNEVDPISASKIHKNNRKRVVRALQIYLEQGKTKAEIEEQQEHKYLYDIKFIGLKPERSLMYANIEKRVDIMFENGLEKEASKLFAEFPKENKALQAIGYKEFVDESCKSIDDIKNLIKKNTRNYAKRQLTFFLHQFDNIDWFETAEEALNFIKSGK